MGWEAGGGPEIREGKKGKKIERERKRGLAFDVEGRRLFENSMISEDGPGILYCFGGVYEGAFAKNIQKLVLWMCEFVLRPPPTTPQHYLPD